MQEERTQLVKPRTNAGKQEGCDSLPIAHTQPRDLVVFLTGKITSTATHVALLEPRSVILTKQCILYLVIINLKPNIPKI